MTSLKFPDISSFSRQVVTLYQTRQTRCYTTLWGIDDGKLCDNLKHLLRLTINDPIVQQRVNGMVGSLIRPTNLLKIYSHVYVARVAKTVNTLAKLQQK